MLKIKIICLGKLKESYWRDAEAEYLKRLGPFAKIEIIELAEISFQPKDEPEKIKIREGESILKNIKDDEFVIALDERGKEKGSEELAHFLEETGQRGQTITFVIGGPLGLSGEVLSHANLQLSFSRLTFTHQMMRVILLEQIYRSGNILMGKIYHY
jgi:23S rRNA (pseudouridine1915-N3)-methyltransferase